MAFESRRNFYPNLQLIVFHIQELSLNVGLNMLNRQGSIDSLQALTITGIVIMVEKITFLFSYKRKVKH